MQTKIKLKKTHVCVGKYTYMDYLRQTWRLLFSGSSATSLLPLPPQLFVIISSRKVQDFFFSVRDLGSKETLRPAARRPPPGPTFRGLSKFKESYPKVTVGERTGVLESGVWTLPLVHPFFYVWSRLKWSLSPCLLQKPRRGPYW